MDCRLREIRRSRRLTQKVLAEQIGCSVGAYSKYETGDREPPLDILNKLADFYGVSVDYLVGREASEIGTLTESEKELVEVFRRSSEFVRDSVLGLMELLENNYQNK